MAFPLGNKPLPGYPMPVGDTYLAEFDHTGPASYTQFTSPATGGDVLKTPSGGINFGGFDDVSSGVVDTTGQIIAYVVPNLGGYANAVPQVIIVYYSLVTATVGGQSQTVGAQVAAATNLSTFSFRFRATCV